LQKVLLEEALDFVLADLPMLIARFQFKVGLGILRK
jgi:hypothetical protein